MVLEVVVVELWLFRGWALHLGDLGPGPGFIKEALGVTGILAGHPCEVLVWIT